MDPDTEVESIFTQINEEADKEEEKKRERPPSSYGSMKSDLMEEQIEEELDQVFQLPFPAVLPESTTHQGTGLQMIRSSSPETLYTMTTQQTKPPGAVVIDTRSSDLEGCSENDDDDDEADEILMTHSPEPPEPVEPEDTTQPDENSQPGRLHPEQALPHIFKSIQNAVTELTYEDLLKFKVSFYQWEPKISLPQVMEGDLLDFVDKILEILGQDRALMHTISTLEAIKKNQEADVLKNKCSKALIRYHLQQSLMLKYKIIHEGVPQPGKQNRLNKVYIEPLISTCGYGGVDPAHEFRAHLPSPIQVPSADTFVGVNNLFRLQKDDGKPVRTLVTTGIPGIGMSVSVAKFCLDWAELRANKDLHFVFKLSFGNLWRLRNNEVPLSHNLSAMEMIEYYHPECKGMKYMEEEDCECVIILESFDCYQTSLDWQNAPVINDNYTKAHPDVLIVNIIRGTVLRGARLWILGRRAAVSQIPSQYIDIVTEIQGFSDEKVEEFLTLRFSSAALSTKIIRHYKRLPSLIVLARQPLMSWFVATVFSRCYRYQGYGEHPPRLTPFYVHIMMIQTNRRLEFYCGKMDHELTWSSDEKNLLTKIGKMAFKMLEKNTNVFFEEDVKECDLKLTDVTVCSGLSTELPAAASGKRTFCFTHFSLQEFMAAMYVFTMFHTESRNVLDTALHKPKIFKFKDQTKSAASLMQCALTRTLASPLGHYEMFLRFLCGLLSPDCHVNMLEGFLYPHKSPKVVGLDDVQRLLEQAILTAEGNQRDRVENLKESLREMIQEHE
ncbi:NACHT, LRR and PYD domains-containing protein 6 [Clinocottus analis]|uniref:NACHT, LRR and PYD domains-containing protein 6 n=1 Tax=Clinocottus analis TaxID=304258 RepID=UPI0035C20F9E